MRDSETCCVQRGGVVSFQPDMGEQIRATPALYCFGARECAPAPAVRVQPRHCLCARTSSDRPSTFPGAPCSVPGHQLRWNLSLSSLCIGSDVACPTGSTPPLHPQICRDPASARGPLHRSPGEMIIMTSAHSKGRR